jgi:hypothetical protein
LFVDGITLVNGRFNPLQHVTTADRSIVEEVGKMLGLMVFFRVLGYLALRFLNVDRLVID